MVVESRNIYMGDKEAFFNYIVDVKKEVGTQLRPLKKMDRISQCVQWHKHVLKPCSQRVVTAVRSKSNQIFKNGTLLFSEQNAKEEVALAKAELGYAVSALES